MSIRAAVDFIASLEIHTEPIILLMSGAQAAVGVLTPTLSQSKMNRTYVPPADEDPDIYINKQMVYWDQQYDYVNIPISCIMAVIYGGLSDYYGRKLPILIGIIAVIFQTSLQMLIYSADTNWPLEIFYPTAALAGILGGASLTMTCANSYMTDQFPDKKQLSRRMVVLSISFSLGSFGGAQLTDILNERVSLIGVMAIALGVSLAAFIYALFMLRWSTPKRYAVEEEPYKTEGDSESHSSESEECEEEDKIRQRPSPLLIVKTSFVSIYEAAKVFVVKRDGHKRMFLYACFFANFLDQLIFGEMKGLIGTYTKLKPFEWTTHDYALYKSIRPIVAIVGMFVGLILFKKFLKLRDTTCICLAIASMGINVLCIGFARVSWLIYASLGPGSLHGLLNPLTFTFMSSLVEQNEVGKAYAISSIAQQIAVIAQTAILQNIYRATVDWYQGFVWMVMAALSLLAFVLYAVVHVIAKRENIGS